MIVSGRVAASSSAKSLTLNSLRSGPFSWTKSASASACFKSVVTSDDRAMLWVRIQLR